MELTREEANNIEAYRNAPEAYQIAVLRLLELDDDECEKE